MMAVWFFKLVSMVKVKSSQSLFKLQLQKPDTLTELISYNWYKFITNVK